jgi:hypothetical protein
MLFLLLSLLLLLLLITLIHANAVVVMEQHTFLYYYGAFQLPLDDNSAKSILDAGTLLHYRPQTVLSEKKLLIFLVCVKN